MPKKDYISDLGALALASRLRRLLQRLHADGQRVYQELNTSFQPKWFPFLNLLSRRAPLTITEISKLMCVSHPSAIEVIQELISAGVIKSRISDRDRRSRELSLTRKGKQLCHDLAPVWNAFRVAGEEANKEGGNDFLKAVGTIEQSLDRLSMYDRIMAELETSKTNRKSNPV